MFGGFTASVIRSSGVQIVMAYVGDTFDSRFYVGDVVRVQMPRGHNKRGVWGISVLYTTSAEAKFDGATGRVTSVNPRGSHTIPLYLVDFRDFDNSRVGIPWQAQWFREEWLELVERTHDPAAVRSLAGVAAAAVRPEMPSPLSAPRFPPAEPEGFVAPVGPDGQMPVAGEQAPETEYVYATTDISTSENEDSPVVKEDAGTPTGPGEMGGFPVADDLHVPPPSASGQEAPLGAVLVSGERDCPPGFPIKGNLQSMIFHTPQSPHYDRVIPEICFANETDARAAGYRPPRSRGED